MHEKYGRKRAGPWSPLPEPTLPCASSRYRYTCLVSSTRLAVEEQQKGLSRDAYDGKGP